MPFHVGKTMNRSERLATSAVAPQSDAGTSSGVKAAVGTPVAVYGAADRPRATSRRHASTPELDRERLTKRFAGRPGDGVRIVDAPLRVPVQLTGEVTGMRVVPRAGSPWLELSVSDGSAVAKVVFTGRRRIAGVNPGRAITVTGVAREDAAGLTIMNPRYEL